MLGSLVVGVLHGSLVPPCMRAWVVKMLALDEAIWMFQTPNLWSFLEWSSCPAGGNKEDSAGPGERTQAQLLRTPEVKRSGFFGRVHGLCSAGVLLWFHPSESTLTEHRLIVHKRREKKNWSCWWCSFQLINCSFTGNKKQTVVTYWTTVFAIQHSFFLWEHDVSFNASVNGHSLCVLWLLLFSDSLLNGTESRALHICIKLRNQL